jgi:hypothetical protein
LNRVSKTKGLEAAQRVAIIGKLCPHTETPWQLQDKEPSGLTYYLYNTETCNSPKVGETYVGHGFVQQLQILESFNFYR